jgi:hypothetical protein
VQLPDDPQSRFSLVSDQKVGDKEKTSLDPDDKVKTIPLL